MELTTASRLLPLLPATQSSNSPKSRLNRSSQSPLPRHYNIVYREMVLREKEFISRNKYAKKLACHFATPRTFPAKKGDRGRRESPRLIRGRAALGVSGLPALCKSVQKSQLRSMLDQYDVTESWVAANQQNSPRRTSSIVGDRRSLSPKSPSEVSKKQLTTVTLSLMAKGSDITRSRDGDESMHAQTFDVSPGRKGRVPRSGFPKI